MEHVGSISAFYGTDHGICAKIYPQTFASADMVPDRGPAVLDKILAEPGVRNGVNNGVTLVLDAEVYDYADNRR